MSRLSTEFFLCLKLNSFTRKHYGVDFVGQLFDILIQYVILNHLYFQECFLELKFLVFFLVLL